MKRALILAVLVACGPPPSPSPSPSPSSTSAPTPVASAVPSATAPPPELPPGPEWPRAAMPVYALAEAPVVELPALAKYSDVRVDADGVTLPKGAVRRFGGDRFHVSSSSHVFFDGNTLFASASSWRGPVRIYELSTGKLRHKLSNGEHLYLADAGRIVLGYKDPSVVVAKTGRRFGPRKGLTSPYAWAMNALVGAEGQSIVAWTPGGASRTLHRFASSERMTALRSNRGSVVAALVRVTTAKGKREQEKLFIKDVRTGRHRSVDLGARSYDRAYGVAADGAVIIEMGGELRRVELTGTQPPTKIRKMPGMGDLLAVGDKLGAIEQLGSGYPPTEPKVVVFELKTGFARATIPFAGEVQQMLFAPNDASLVTVDDRGEVRRFDPLTGDETPRPPGHAWTSSAHLEASGARLVTGGSRLDVWDAAGNRHLRGRDLGSYLVDARIVNDNTAVTLSETGQAQWWSIDTMTAEAMFEQNRSGGRFGEGNDFEKGTLDAFQDRVAVARGLREGVTVFNADRDEVYSTKGPTRGLRFGPHGELAVAGEGDLTIYDPKGHIVWRRPFTFPRDGYARPSELRASLAFSPSGRRLAVATGSGGVVVDLVSGAVLRGMNVKWQPLAFEDEDHLLAGGAGELQRWSVTKAESGSMAVDGAVRALQVHRHGVLVTLESGTSTILKREQLPPLKSAPGLDTKASVLVATLPGVTQLATSESYRTGAICALHAGGTSCWGSGDYGVTGFGDTKAREKPELLPVKLKSVALGYLFGCGLDPEQNYRCWGRIDVTTGLRGRKGEVTPQLLEGIEQPVRDGALYRERWCVADRKGDVVCTSLRTQGYRTTTERHTVVGVRDARKVALGNRHGCAITGPGPAGPVWCWGTENDLGQIGFGRTTPTAPAHALRVKGIDDATALVAGRAHTCALRKAGTVACWGSGLQGQVGDGTRASRPRAVAVKGLTGVTSLTAAELATFAVTADGRVHVWGFAGPWESSVPLPVVVPGFTDTVALAADDHSVCAADTSGAIRCVGRNFHVPKPSPKP